MEPESNNFGVRLRSMVAAKGATVGQFCLAMEIGESQAFNWFKREKPVPPKYWGKLSEYFGVSEAYLLTGIPEKKGRGDAYDATHVGASASGDDSAHYGTDEQIERELHEKFVDLLVQARGNRDRLGWISEQMSEHLSPPKSWFKAGAQKKIPLTTLARTLPISSKTGKPILPQIPPGALPAAQTG